MGASQEGPGSREPSPEEVSAVPASIPSAEPRTWMKEPCGPCPYSRSKTLWLHPERAEDFAYNASNRYSDFPCHKTADLVEDDDGSGEYLAGERSLTCNGFLSLQVNENGGGPEGFEPHPDAFCDTWEMTDHHREEYDRRRLGRCPASAIEAQSAETERLGPKDESAVIEDETPKLKYNPTNQESVI